MCTYSRTGSLCGRPEDFPQDRLLKGAAGPQQEWPQLALCGRAYLSD